MRADLEVEVSPHSSNAELLPIGHSKFLGFNKVVIVNRWCLIR